LKIYLKIHIYIFMDLKSLAEEYFRVWNTHNSKDVGNLFDECGVLRLGNIRERKEKHNKSKSKHI